MPIVAASDPDEFGGRTFQADDGSELYFFGPEAEALASGLARQPDLRTAQAAPPVDFGGVADFERQWAPPAPAAPPVQQRRDVPMMQKRSDVVVPPPTPSLQGPAQPMAPTAPPAGPEMVTLPGSAGVDPRRMIERGVMVPTGETVSEAIPIDPELQAVRQGISAEEMAVRQQQTQTAIAKSRAQELQAAARLPELEMQAAEAQHAARQVEQLYEQERADIGAMLEEHQSRRVNPDRYWQNKGAFGSVMTTLAVILGAFASGVSSAHGSPLPNVALEQVNREIERDIALQQDEIDREGVNARNSLALLQHRFGDLQQAKDALKLAMHDVADMQAKELLAEYGTQEALQAYQLWQVEHMKEREALERKIRDASVGKHTTARKFIQPQAGTPSRRVAIDDLPLDQRAKAYKNLSDIAVAKATVSGGGVSPDKRAQVIAEGGVDWRELHKFGASMASVADARQGFSDLLAEAGLRYNEDTRRVEGAAEGGKLPEDIPGVGLIDRRLPRIALGERGRRVTQKLDNFRDKLLRMRSGAAITDQEYERLTKIVDGMGTEGEFVNGVEMLSRELQSIEDTNRASFRPEVLDAFNKNRMLIERGRSSQAAEEELDPY